MGDFIGIVVFSVKWFLRKKKIEDFWKKCLIFLKMLLLVLLYFLWFYYDLEIMI